MFPTPDLRLNYSAGGAPLHFQLDDYRLILRVQTPDGDASCGTAHLTIPAAMSGSYDIWVGVTEVNLNVQTRLTITENHEVAAPPPARLGPTTPYVEERLRQIREEARRDGVSLTDEQLRDIEAALQAEQASSPH
ncbi:hypothetical protein [Maricaulis sp. CAU 1757]